MNFQNNITFNLIHIKIFKTKKKATSKLLKFQRFYFKQNAYIYYFDFYRNEKNIYNYFTSVLQE